MNPHRTIAVQAAALQSTCRSGGCRRARDLFGNEAAHTYLVGVLDEAARDGRQIRSSQTRCNDERRGGYAGLPKAPPKMKDPSGGTTGRVKAI
jgi:hypothetical protein